MNRETNMAAHEVNGLELMRGKKFMLVACQAASLALGWWRAIQIECTQQQEAGKVVVRAATMAGQREENKSNRLPLRDCSLVNWLLGHAATD